MARKNYLNPMVMKFSKKCIMAALVSCMIFSLGGCKEPTTIEPSPDMVPTTVLEPSPDMVPTTVSLKGMAAGYLYIPYGENVYRYRPYDKSVEAMNPEDIETSELIYECTENGEISWEIYSLKNFPGLDMVLGKNITDGWDVVFSYFPSQKSEPGALEDAMDNGFVIMKNGSGIFGKDIWIDFYEKTQKGEPCSVRIGFYYTNENANMTEELFEAESEDVPVIYFSQLDYDGSSYTISPVNKIDGEYIIYEVEGQDTPAETFKYLMHYKDKARYDFALFSAYDKYVLTDREDVTWDQLEYGSISSSFEDMIPYREVYNEYTWK